MAADATDWREGLEQVGTCPHCGVPVYVRPGDVNGTTLLPTPVYLCACRHLAVALSSIPVPPAPAVPPTWSPPVRPSTDDAPWRRPFRPLAPNPLQPPFYPSDPAPGLPGGPPGITCGSDYPEDPTHPGLPPYTARLNAPGGDY